MILRSQTQKGGGVSALFIMGEKMLEVEVELEVLEMLKNLSFDQGVHSFKKVLRE